MVDKVCYKCNETKEESLFKRNYNVKYIKYTNKCTTCSSIEYELWRKKNIVAANAQARQRRNERKLRAIAYLGGACAHCKCEVHQAAFDFHHLNPDEKERDPGLMMSMSDAKLFLELDKCILLCSNCHRIHHFKENQ